MVCWHYVYKKENYGKSGDIMFIKNKIMVFWHYLYKNKIMSSVVTLCL